MLFHGVEFLGQPYDQCVELTNDSKWVKNVTIELKIVIIDFYRDG